MRRADNSHTQSRGLRREDAHQIRSQRESPHACKNHHHHSWSAHLRGEHSECSYVKEHVGNSL
jgi:hypothetical protein